MAKVILRRQKAAPFFGRHPWVLDSAVGQVEGRAENGDVVDLLSDKGQWIAKGIYNGNSRIRVRLYTWDPSQELNDDFWRRRLEHAVDLRRRLGYDDPGGAARLVFSEADGLSGLIVDRYGEHLVVQVTALALAVRIDSIAAMLAELLAPHSIHLRTDASVAKAEGIEASQRLLIGEPAEAPVFVTEHGIRYGVDLGEGQKTGFYLDQRENRREAAASMHGRRVLDLFCYSGGFGLAAAVLGGAREVLGIDGSAKAVALAKANAELNGIANAKFEVGDAFETLDTLAGSGERFGAVILDPPKFAKSRRNVDEALRAYHRLNRVAVEILEPGGILVTCSCSGHVTPDDFLMMLVGVAQKSRRTIQVLERRGAAPDHPVNVSCLETEYLKCAICRVG